MLKVGLTGSIAVGKSFVSAVFIELACAVLDADETARAVVAPGTVGWQQIVEVFGRDILNSDDSLNRAKLGTIVFANETKRAQLNAIVHPLIFAAQTDWLAAIEAKDPNAIAIIDAALLIESGNYRKFDKIIVVWCEPEIQLARLMKRNDLSAEDAARRVAAQMPQHEKKQYADFLIETSNGFDDTRERTIQVYRSLKELTIKE